MMALLDDNRPNLAAQRGTQNPIDIQVGQTVKRRRAVVGMSQTELANELGITFQQVQKYEKGANRISASRLYLIAKILGCTIESLFDGVEKLGLDPDVSAPEIERAKRMTDFANSPQGIQLLNAVSGMETIRRKRLVSLATAIADTA